MKIIPTWEQVNLAKEYVKSWDKKVKDYFTPDEQSKLFGIISQMIIADMLKIEKPVNKGADGGVDIVWNGKTWDIKTEIRNVDFKPSTFVHNLHAPQIKNNVDGYWFVCYNREKGEYDVRGFIEKDKFIKHALFYQGETKRQRSDGSWMEIKPGGMYELKDRHLTKWKQGNKQ